MQILPPSQATAQTYVLASNVAKAANDLPSGLRLLEHAQASENPPTAYLYANIITICQRTGDVEAAFRLYSNMLAANIKADKHVISALISACAAAVPSLTQHIRTGDSAALGSTQVCINAHC